MGWHVPRKLASGAICWTGVPVGLGPPSSRICLCLGGHTFPTCLLTWGMEGVSRLCSRPASVSPGLTRLLVPSDLACSCRRWHHLPGLCPAPLPLAISSVAKCDPMAKTMLPGLLASMQSLSSAKATGFLGTERTQGVQGDVPVLTALDPATAFATSSHQRGGQCPACRARLGRLAHYPGQAASSQERGGPPTSQIPSNVPVGRGLSHHAPRHCTEQSMGSVLLTGADGRKVFAEIRAEETPA